MKKSSIFTLFILVLILSGLGYFAITNESVATPQVTAKSIMYICMDKKMIGAKFYTQIYPEPKTPKEGEPPVPTGSVDLTLSDGRSMHLAQTISGSGVRYANKDESFIFWTKGTGVIVLEDNEEKTFVNCEERVRSMPVTASSTQKYLYDGKDFSLILPRFTTPPALKRADSYEVDTSYTYGLIVGEAIHGTRFTIPKSITEGTNLSHDSYISVEHIDNVKKCTGSMFLENEPTSEQITEKGIAYSVASGNGAAAGNRYEETVYATRNGNTCFAVRYFIHSTVFENYPIGSIQKFDKEKLLAMFDTVRKTLTIHN